MAREASHGAYHGASQTEGLVAPRYRNKQAQAHRISFCSPGRSGAASSPSCRIVWCTRRPHEPTGRNLRYIRNSPREYCGALARSGSTEDGGKFRWTRRRNQGIYERKNRPEGKETVLRRPDLSSRDSAI